ncbi:MAG: phage tail tape measure protein [Planctomycetes bacterium]|nr:phage tail tape measure protein [Planctomycetota bacterium]
MANSTAIRAGRAFVELFADDSKLVRGLRRAEKKLKAFGDSVRNLGLKMAGIGAAMLGPLAIAGRIFSGFDDQMRTVKAVTGATAEEFDRLTEKAKLLGRTTSYTAAEVAAGMTELGRAGFAPDEIDAAIAHVLNLGRATGVDLAEAAGIAGASLRAFGLEAGQIGRVADVLTATANGSAQSISELGESMKYAAPVAATYGMSLEDTSKALGALANFGIKGSMAGNTLKRVMLQLANTDVQKTLGWLGVGVMDQAGNLRNVSDVLIDIGKAMDQMGQGQRVSMLSELFGDRAIAGAAKLTGAAFDRLNESIDNASGTAARTAEEMDAGIGGALRRLWSAVEGIALAVGDALAPVVSDLADKLSAAAGYVTAFLVENRELIVTVAKIAAGILAAGVALTILGTLIGGVGSALGVLATIATGVGSALALVGTILGALLSPIGLVIAAVAALAAYLLHATGAAAKALGWLGEKFSVLKDEATTAYGGIADALAAGDIALAARILWLTLKMEFQKGIRVLQKAWLSFKHFFIRVAYGAWYGALALAETIWHGLEVAWIETVAFLGKAWDGFVGFFRRSWEHMVAFAKKAWVWIKWLFGQSTDLDEEYASIDAERDAAINEIDDEQKRKSAARELERQRKREAASRTHDATMAEIGRGYLDKDRELDDEYRRKMGDSEEALAKARDEWRKAIEEARTKRQQKDAGDDEPPGDLKSPEELVGNLENSLSGLGDMLQQTADKITVTGTFNAAAVAGLGAGDAAERTAKATEETAKNTKKLAQSAQSGGLTFA